MREREMCEREESGEGGDVERRLLFFRFKTRASCSLASIRRVCRVLLEAATTKAPRAEGQEEEENADKGKKIVKWGGGG